MTKQVRQSITPTHLLGATGTAEACSLGYRPLADAKGDLGLGTTLTRVLNNGAGTATAPAISFVGDPDTGIYNSAANTLAITTNGVLRASVSTTLFTSVNDASINGVLVGRGANSCATNTAVGCSALAANTTGGGNTAIGNLAMASNTSGGANTAVGNQALRCNTTGTANTAIGGGAMCLNTTGEFNTAMGLNALRDNTSGTRNTAIGNNALACNTTAGCNTAVGMDALRDNTTGAENTALGRAALGVNTTGCTNTAVGACALFCNTTGSRSVAVGFGALRVQNPSAAANMNNVAVGFQAGNAMTTGTNNLAVGTNAAVTGLTPQGIVNLTTESNRIVMGNDAHTCAQIKIAWTATSDCRDKLCFAPIEIGLDFVRALEPTEYQFKAGGRDSTVTDGKRRYGFIAQQMMPLEGDDPVIISADDPEKLQYTEAHLIPVLVNAIKELADRVEVLESA